MNLIRWIASTVLSAMLLPQILGIGGQAAGVPLPPEYEHEFAAITAEVERQGGQVHAVEDSIFVIGTDEVMDVLEQGWDGLVPIVEVVQQVKSATAAASGPSALPPGVRLVRVSFELARPVGEATD